MGTDDGEQWCADTADDCPTSIKKLPTMAADKRSSKKDCDGTDCGNNWCCNESDYPVCCPMGDDGTQWCADVDQGTKCEEWKDEKKKFCDSIVHSNYKLAACVHCTRYTLCRRISSSI